MQLQSRLNSGKRAEMRLIDLSSKLALIARRFRRNLNRRSMPAKCLAEERNQALSRIPNPSCVSLFLAHASQVQ